MTFVTDTMTQKCLWKKISLCFSDRLWLQLITHQLKCHISTGRQFWVKTKGVIVRVIKTVFQLWLPLNNLLVYCEKGIDCYCRDSNSVQSHPCKSGKSLPTSDYFLMDEYPCSTGQRHNRKASCEAFSVNLINFSPIRKITWVYQCLYRQWQPPKLH